MSLERLQCKECQGRGVPDATPTETDRWGATYGKEKARCNSRDETEFLS